MRTRGEEERGVEAYALPRSFSRHSFTFPAYENGKDDGASLWSSPSFTSTPRWQNAEFLKRAASVRTRDMLKDVDVCPSRAYSASFSYSSRGLNLHLGLSHKMNTNDNEKPLVASSSSPPPPPPAIAVGISKGKHSKHALQWALDHLVSQGESIQIIHVKRPTDKGNKISSTLASKHIADAYWQANSQTQKRLLPYIEMCQSRKVQAVITVLEEYSIPFAIVKHISKCNIMKMVMGSSSPNRIVRMFKPPDVAARVSRIAPKFCTIYIVAKGNRASVHSAFSSNRINITYDDNGSTISGRISDVSISGQQIQSKGEPDSGSGQDNMLYSQLPLLTKQDVSFGNQAKNQEYAELQSDKQKRRLREESSIKDMHECLIHDRSQTLTVPIESGSLEPRSINEHYQLNRVSEAKETKYYDLERRLQDSTKLSRGISNSNDESFLLSENQAPWNGISSSDLYYAHHHSLSQYSNTSMHEMTHSVESQFVTNTNLFSKIAECVNKDNQLLGTPNKNGKQESLEFRESSSGHLLFPFTAEISFEEGEAYFEICPSDIKDSGPLSTFNGETLGIASKTLDNGSFNSEKRHGLNEPLALPEIHLDSSPTRLIEDIGSDMEELKHEIENLLYMYSIVYEEAITATRKAQELDLQRVEAASKLQEAKIREERALAIAAEEKARRETAVAEAETAKRIAEFEARLRKDAEITMATRQQRI